ncbi:hypothetical protein, partial [Streptomyces europaeiscabiei]|uniref:hypothetical protein n=1 Tax=Streptomyces europaeiscabiei TaxID=146819 RepID=UPI0038F6C46E
FNTTQLHLENDIAKVVEACDVLVIAVPSAFTEDALKQLKREAFQGKKIMSAIKGILPSQNQLLNDFLFEYFDVALKDYVTILGPCHAE